MIEPRGRRTTVRELIRTNPEARERLGRAYAELLAAVLAALACLGFAAAWIIRRRARRVREGLSPPRPVRWPENHEPGES